MDSPRKVIANKSPWPKASAALDSGLLMANMTMAENRPPMAEQNSATPSALPALPSLAMG